MNELNLADLSNEPVAARLAHAKVLCNAERFDEADELCRKVLDIEPSNSIALYQRGLIAYRRGDYEGAADRLMEAIGNDPQPDYYFALGNAMAAHNRPSAAAECFLIAAQLRPDHADTHNNLGIAQRALKRYGDAVASFCRVLELQPENGRAYNNLANTLLEMNELPAALEAWQLAQTLAPGFSEPHSNRLFALHYTDATTPQQYLDEVRRFSNLAHRTIQPFKSWLVATSARTDRPLRVGIVSGDLRRHPVGYFLESVVSNLDAQRIELIAYSTHRFEDELTARLKPRFAGWQDISALSDIAAAQQIRSDRIDVLIDASGHTTHNRLLVFASKPAPIQVSWPGYFASTGLEAIDYVLGDRYTLPESEASHFVEKPWRLPDSYLCFTPPASPVEVGPLPLEKNGFVTFGYFGLLTKVTDAVVETWSAILQRVPGARLFLKSRQLDIDDVRAATLARFAERGIEAHRLILEGFSDRALYLQAYNRVDISLSPFPYPAGTTAAESLWMGVPVLGLKGERFVSHIVESIVHTAGLDEAWLANDRDAYIERAVANAADKHTLGALRAGLRARLLASPLCDAQRFARHFENALHAMWDDYATKRLLTNREA